MILTKTRLIFSFRNTRRAVIHATLLPATSYSLPSPRSVWIWWPRYVKWKIRNLRDTRKTQEFCQKIASHCSVDSYWWSWRKNNRILRSRYIPKVSLWNICDDRPKEFVVYIIVVFLWNVKVSEAHISNDITDLKWNAQQTAEEKIRFLKGFLPGCYRLESVVVCLNSTKAV